MRRRTARSSAPYSHLASLTGRILSSAPTSLRSAAADTIHRATLEDQADSHPIDSADKLKLEQQKPIFKKRAELAAKVKDFWFTALENCGKTAQFIDAVDEEALKALKDVWIEHSADDVREYEIRFTFGKNPYFKNTTLVKKLTLQPPADLADKADTPKPFDLDVPVYLADKTPIDWTSPDHDLTKKAPRSHADEREEFDEFEGPGSFFNWFGETGEDRTSLAEVLVEWWAHATECVVLCLLCGLLCRAVRVLTRDPMPQVRRGPHPPRRRRVRRRVRLRQRV